MNDFLVGFILFSIVRWIYWIYTDNKEFPPDSELEKSKSKIYCFLHSVCVTVFHVALVLLAIVTLGLLELDIKPRD